MQIAFRIARFVVLALAACVLGVSAQAQAWSCDPSTTQNQICTYNPVDGSVVTSTPVWLKAVVNSCAGSSNITAFGYTINNENFWNQGTTNFDIDTTDYRLIPGGTYKVWFKAWSDRGACTAVPVTVTVNTGETWHYSYENVNAYQNATEPNGSPWQPPPCDYYNPASGSFGTWYWNWDAGTAKCTDSAVTDSYWNSSVSPTVDNKSRLFYVDWTAVPTVINGHTYDNPGERYSAQYADNSNNAWGDAVGARNFVYDGYIYLAANPDGSLPGPDANIYALQMDMNQVAPIGPNTDVVIYGFQCVSSQSDTRGDNPPPPASWQYTANGGWETGVVAPSNKPLDCHQLFIPKMWHHVQLKAHTDGTGGAYYDSITLDGTTTLTPTWYGNSSTSVGWPLQLFLNFQIDGMSNGGNPATAVVYLDGMTMIWW